MRQQTKTFDLSPYGLEIQSFTLRRLTGEDELAAAERAGAGAAAFVEQLVADAICEVDGQPVPRPFLDWRKWEIPTRNFVRAAFNRYCEASERDLAGFLTAAFGDG